MCEVHAWSESDKMNQLWLNGSNGQRRNETLKEAGRVEGPNAVWQAGEQRTRRRTGPGGGLDPEEESSNEL